MPCDCCSAPCSCANDTPKVYVTVDGDTKGLAVCDFASWLLCGTSPSAAAYASALTEYTPAPPAAPTALRVTLSSGYNSLGNCLGTTIIGAGTTWVYEYALNNQNCPTGDPALVSEASSDNTDLCDEPGECCNQACFGIMPTPTLSLLP
jgi:hypothetical protein